MNCLSEYSKQEEEAWAQAEFLEEKSPGLFSLSPKWFKFSDYEILSTKLGLYIAPAIGSIKETYEPFKLFPAILKDYLRLLIEIEGLYYSNADENCSENESIKLFQSLDLKRAETILPFVKKYGLFGLFHASSRETLFGAPAECNVILNPNARRYLYRLFQENNINNNYSIEYQKLAAYFLPRLAFPYPNANESKVQAKTFYENYAEPVNGMISYPDISRILRYEKLLKEYESSGSGLDDSVESIRQQNGRTNLTFKRVLNFKINDLGIILAPENGIWDLRWNFKSLFSALSIMYIMNKAGKMGSKIQTCQYSKCSEITLGKKYCCSQHADAARQERCRANKKKKEVL